MAREKRGQKYKIRSIVYIRRLTTPPFPTSVILSFFIIEPGKFWLACLSSEESKAEENL